MVGAHGVICIIDGMIWECQQCVMDVRNRLYDCQQNGTYFMDDPIESAALCWTTRANLKESRPPAKRLQRRTMQLSWPRFNTHDNTSWQAKYLYRESRLSHSFVSPKLKGSAAAEVYTVSSTLSSVAYTEWAAKWRTVIFTITFPILKQFQYFRHLAINWPSTICEALSAWRIDSGA